MHPAAEAADARAEIGVVEVAARGHALRLLIGDARQHPTVGQRRPVVLGAEGIEVEGGGGGGEEGES
jgi:hypothetical protein